MGLYKLNGEKLVEIKRDGAKMVSSGRETVSGISGYLRLSVACQSVSWRETRPDRTEVPKRSSGVQAGSDGKTKCVIVGSLLRRDDRAGRASDVGATDT